MGIFSKPQPLPAPQISDKDRLAEIELEYSAAEEAFRQACAAVNNYVHAHKRVDNTRIIGNGVYVTVNAHKQVAPELARLNGVQQRAHTRRNELLRQRTELRRAMGLIR